MGDIIVSFLTQEPQHYKRFRVCVAFVKASGVLRLVPAIECFRGKGGIVEIVAGIDEGVTSKQGLELLAKYCSVVSVFHNPVSTFHPKFYLFEAPGDSAALFVGSNNLTAGGLYANYEMSLGLKLKLSVPEDKALYDQVQAYFSYATDVESGNARVLNPHLIQELAAQGYICDESTQKPKLSHNPKGKSATIPPPLFAKTPIVPPPSIPPELKGLIPKPVFAEKEAKSEKAKEYEPGQVFCMVLGERDTRQKAGYSPDIFIPLSARDQDPVFWGWPKKFQIHAGQKGEYPERFLKMLVRPVNGVAEVLEDVRLYYYNIKHEFRLNCGRLIQGASPNDVLVVQRPPLGTFYEGELYEYEAMVIAQGSPSYQSFNKLCTNVVKGSAKRWGYVNG